MKSITYDLSEVGYVKLILYIKFGTYRLILSQVRTTSLTSGVNLLHQGNTHLRHKDHICDTKNDLLTLFP